MTIPGAIALTGVVLFVLTIGYSGWVAAESRGAYREKWHRPLVAFGWLVTGAVFIVAVWAEVGR